MRTFASILALLVVLILFWSWPREGSGGPRYGSVPIYPGRHHIARFILAWKQTTSRQCMHAITRYGGTNGIKRCKIYLAYSGPPTAKYTGEHIAIFIRSEETTYCVALHKRGFAGGKLFDITHWPTNGSRVTLNGHSVQMPFTGFISVSPFGTNYSVEEFRRVSDGLAATLRLTFTNRSIDIFMSDTNRP